MPSSTPSARELDAGDARAGVGGRGGDGDDPETVAPEAGEVSETTGAVVSAGAGTVTETLEFAELPATS